MAEMQPPARAGLNQRLPRDVHDQQACCCRQRSYSGTGTAPPSQKPEAIIRRIEIGASSHAARIRALNAVCEAGYPVGMLIAPIILLPDWKRIYGELIDCLADTLSTSVKRSGFVEIIFMSYSYIQNAINMDAFPGRTPLFDQA